MSRCLLKVSKIFCGTVAALALNPRDGQIICTPVFSQLNLLLFSKISKYVTRFGDWCHMILKY